MQDIASFFIFVNSFASYNILLNRNSLHANFKTCKKSFTFMG
ncbi:uncharacterized protein METZ01_LOCUS298680, partial [marine metagenome]